MHQVINVICFRALLKAEGCPRTSAICALPMMAVGHRRITSASPVTKRIEVSKGAMRQRLLPWGASSFLWLPSVQRIEIQENPSDLARKQWFLPTETIERVVDQIG